VYEHEFLSSIRKETVDFIVQEMFVTYVFSLEEETRNERRKIETICYDVGRTRLSELFPKMATERRL
jgi:hypothetical protein